MTDATKVVEMLERCIDESDCDSCDYVDNCACKEYLLQDAIDTINRQKAEIERLQKILGETSKVLSETCAGVGVKAIKEFAEKLKNKLQHRALFSVIDTINEVLREMGVISNDK